jgi:hypothetical protein
MSSSTEHITRCCEDCRKLIVQLLETREEIDRLVARSPASPAIDVLRDKAAKLQAATEKQFLRAMDALGDVRR